MGGVMGLIADALARQHTGLREFGQFASERAGRRARGSGKLPQMVGLFRMQQEQAENAPAVVSEEQRGE